jgi:hypothetical protein
MKRLLKIQQLLLLIPLLFLFFTNGNAQYKTYKLNDRGDTINGIDKADKKQGKWVIRVDEVRGEPGFEEEGVFKNNNKEGVWRIYNLTGVKMVYNSTTLTLAIYTERKAGVDTTQMLLMIPLPCMVQVVTKL